MQGSSCTRKSTSAGGAQLARSQDKVLQDAQAPRLGPPLPDAQQPGQRVHSPVQEPLVSVGNPVACNITQH
jgi:hypothetical protein